MKAEEKSISDDLAALQKKSKFLEKQNQEANSQLRDIVRRTRFYFVDQKRNSLDVSLSFIAQNQGPNINRYFALWEFSSDRSKAPGISL